MEYFDEYNPFSKFKLLAWANYWRQFEKGVIPAPVAVSVDPVNVCNHRCVWCNAGKVLNNPSMMKRDYMMELAKFLGTWGVRAACIGGGGESLLNPYVGDFIAECARNKIELGLVTNGSNIDTYADELLLCRWVGISVDAATEKTHSRLHGTTNVNFHKAIDNIQRLVKKNAKGRKLEITFKFLIHPGNIHELYKAARLAKALGVDRFHARPAGETWFGLKHKRIFSDADLKAMKRNAAKIFSLETSDYRTHVITSRCYTKTLEIKHDFRKCHAVFMTCVFQPEGLVSLCCDRRGDAALDLCRVKNPKDVLRYWGKERHKRLFHSIKLSACPRCTYSSHNELYENAIKDDRMFLNFI